MHAIHPYKPNALAGSPLDRLDARRRDKAWVQSQLDAPDTHFLPVWRAKNLVATSEKGVEAVFLPGPFARFAAPDAPWALLGAFEGRVVFAVDLSAADTPLAPGAFEDLRRMGGMLPPQDASMLAHARGLMHWRLRHRFCGVCGAACTVHDAGHVMHCTGCGTHHFPRTDPAVIMLVTRGEMALLGQPSAMRTRRVFTTLAGFVEPGESLEEAVAREVREETGVVVANVRYHSSQPWPFPSSLMVGFVAEALSEAIVVDPRELAEARWFTRSELRARDGFNLPPDFSIARRLINSWLE